MLPLDLLSPGEVGRVVDIDGDQELIFRLAEMGVQPGTELQMLRQGSPCILAVDNRRISFRGENAASILVEVVEHRAALPAPAALPAMLSSLPPSASPASLSSPALAIQSVSSQGPVISQGPVSSQTAAGSPLGGSDRSGALRAESSSLGQPVAKPRLLGRWLGVS